MEYLYVPRNSLEEISCCFERFPFLQKKLKVIRGLSTDIMTTRNVSKQECLLAVSRTTPSFFSERKRIVKVEIPNGKLVTFPRNFDKTHVHAKIRFRQIKSSDKSD